MTDPNATNDPASGQPTPPPGYQAPPPGYQAPPPGSGFQQPQQPGYPQPVAAAPLSQADDKQWAFLAQLGGILGFIPPLIIWLIFKDRGPLTNQEGKESLNFQISVAIAVAALYIVGSILAVVFIGFLFYFLAWAVQIAGVVFAIIAGVKVNGGGTYRYPLTFRFIK